MRTPRFFDRDEEEIFGINDAYTGPDLDDEGEYEDLTAAQRRAAEAEMTRRDRAASGRGRGRGSRAAARRRRPGFIEDDEDD